MRATLVLLLGLVALTGCTVPDSGLDAVPGWVEPGWMAQVRQQNESFQNAMIACYAEYGLKGTKTMGGSVGFVNLGDENGQIPPGIQELVDASAEECNARVPLPESSMNHTLDDASYQRMVELRECIIAHRYEVPEPPSAQTWKDSTPWYTAWNPYGPLINGAGSLPADEVYALADACPQPGPNFVILAPSEP